MLERLSQREKVMIVILIFVSAIALYYYFIYQPLQGKIDKLNDQLQIKQKEVADTLELIKELPVLERRYKELGDLEVLAVERGDCTPENVLKTVEKKTSESNVEILTFNPRRKDNGTGLNIIMSGNYRDYCDFLDSLAELKNKVKFEELQLQQDKGDGLRLNIALLCNNREGAGDGSDE